MCWDWTEARLQHIRNTLDAWFRCEYKDSELPNKTWRLVYDLPHPKTINGTVKRLTALADVRQTIVEGYQDCKPKWELLEEIDKAERGIRRSQTQQEAKATIHRQEGAA
jgi:hypothetical protein